MPSNSMYCPDCSVTGKISLLPPSSSDGFANSAGRAAQRVDRAEQDVNRALGGNRVQQQVDLGDMRPVHRVSVDGVASATAIRPRVIRKPLRIALAEQDLHVAPQPTKSRSM